jgi:ubiquinone/menaquinone biosynthesis C-methylase UbiE
LSDIAPDVDRMNHREVDREFTGSVAQVYEHYLVPLIFEPYARDLALRLANRRPLPGKVLEIAAGTGALTRQLASLLPDTVSITATDLNQPMLDQAMSKPTTRSVEWKQADAMNLTFPDESFDAIVCQFGAMFFPDRAMAYRETRRVLRRGGCFLLSVWDRIEENEFPDVITQALARMFPDDPPRFMARTPHGYPLSAVVDDLARGGFVRLEPATISARSRAASARAAAIAFCHGTPLRSEIEQRGRLDEATEAAERELAQRFGAGEVDGKIQAHVILVE